MYPSIKDILNIIRNTYSYTNTKYGRAHKNSSKFSIYRTFCSKIE